MTNHCKNYMRFFDYKIAEDCICEIPGCQIFVNDIHHIIPRSKFGAKTKHLQDDPKNLIGLCRSHHESAHNEILSKEYLTLVHEKFIEQITGCRNVGDNHFEVKIKS